MKGGWMNHIPEYSGKMSDHKQALNDSTQY